MEISAQASPAATGRGDQMVPAARRTSRLLATGVQQRVGQVRIAFGLIWAINAWYKWQPGFAQGFATRFTKSIAGSPPSLRPWFQFWAHFVISHSSFWVLTTLAIETLIAVALILGLGRRSLYLLGAVFSFLIWSIPESFGHLWIAGQTDLGTSIIYVFIYLALFWLDRDTAGGGLAADRWLETRWPWWRYIAEP